MVLDFSITQTLMFGSSCLSRIANDSPAGPAPDGDDVVFHDVTLDRL